MENILSIAIQTVQQSKISFTRFITANDIGATGAHQSGFYINKNSWSLFFDNPGTKGSNKDKFVTIKWQESFETDSRFIYYGSGTRNEYRLTRFGKKFPFFEDDNIGDLLIICKISDTFYKAYILSSDEEIEDFLATLNLSSTETNGIIPKQYEETSEEKISNCFSSYLKSVTLEFPSTIDLATNARNCFNTSFGIKQKHIIENPDKEILNWIYAEFQLFKAFENDRYSSRIQTPFQDVEELVLTANTILNRRKSRAGKSLEHHLAEIFNNFELSYTTQAVTEDNKKPDFLFPDIDAYHNSHFNENKLFMLASKTTCKDRWRQILNEADRIKTKHLFTLQQGISKNQLIEMYKYDVCLVVPKPYLSNFPQEFKDRILTLDTFVNKIRAVQK